MKLYFTLRSVLDQEIFFLAFAIDDQKPQVIYQTKKINEKKLLQTFFKLLSKQITQPHFLWVGFRIHTMLRFLFQRCVILHVTPTIHLPIKNNHGSHWLCDPTKLWSGKLNTLTLSELAYQLHIPLSKTAKYSSIIDQISILEFPEQQQLATLINTCQDTIQCCQACYQRLIFS